MEVVALIVIFFGAIAIQDFIFENFVLNKLEYTCSFSSDEAHAGDDLYFVEVVYNRKLLPVPWLKVDIHSSKWLDFAGTRSVIAQDNRKVTSTFYLRSYQKTTRRWRLKCLKRGVFTTENVTLVAGDLLGNKIVSIPVRVNQTLVVYPEIVNMEELLIKASFLQGDTVVRRWIVDDPFLVSGAREYMPGDPMNRIHWSASAREGSLMVRKNDYTTRLSLAILLNIQSIEFEYSSVVDREMIELGIKVAATVLDKALRDFIPVRFATNGKATESERDFVFTDELSGREHVSSLLNILARLELKSVMDFDNFFDRISGSLGSADVVIITSYINDNICDQARRLQLSGNVVKLIILDRFIELPKLPGDIETYILSGAE